MLVSKIMVNIIIFIASMDVLAKYIGVKVSSSSVCLESYRRMSMGFNYIINDCIISKSGQITNPIIVKVDPVPHYVCECIK